MGGKETEAQAVCAVPHGLYLTAPPILKPGNFSMSQYDWVLSSSALASPGRPCWVLTV